jgi:hypothetical protein
MRASPEHRRIADALAAFLLGMEIACSPTAEVARADRAGVDGPVGVTNASDAAVTVTASVILGRLTEECRGISPPTQDACPALVPLIALAEIPSGVRVQLDSAGDARSALSQLRCRISRATPPDAGRSPTCAFDRPGISVRAASSPEAVEILAADPEALEAIRAAVLADFVSTRASQE